MQLTRIRAVPETGGGSCFPCFSFFTADEYTKYRESFSSFKRQGANEENAYNVSIFTEEKRREEKR